jgi:putative ubiquitin-RnfH superfamily antitoxin RatB of RatAB toxin-antitoxin module
MAPDEVAPIEVELVFAAGAHQVEQIRLTLPAGSSLADALRASGWVERLGAVGVAALQVGIWGRVVEASTPLRARDRIELYRPLSVDPKEARRQRYRRDGVRKLRPR